MRPIALLTDFGLSDPYVGEMKAVLLRLAPASPVVDVTHGVRPGAIREAGWILSRVFPQYPAGTVHVVVVDPGVGSGRRGLVVSAGGHLFVGPDNGVLQAAFEAGSAEIRELAVRELDHVRRGTTFDGRDVFAPAAAGLASGADPATFGPEVTDPVTLPGYRPARRAGGGFEAEIIRADRFGNLITTVEEGFLRETFGEDWRGASVTVGTTSIAGVRLAYADVGVGELLLSIGGSGTLEVSVHGGSARKHLGAGAGDRILLELPADPG